jgi:hypothetical protein
MVDFNKLTSTWNLSDTETAMMMYIMNAHENRKNARIESQKYTETNNENAKNHAASYDGRSVMALGIASGAATFAFALASAISGTAAVASIGDGLGKGFSSGGQWQSGREEGARSLSSHTISHVNNLRDQATDSSRSEAGKTGQGVETLRNMNSSLHQIVSQILGQQG